MDSGDKIVNTIAHLDVALLNVINILDRARVSSTTSFCFLFPNVVLRFRNNTMVLVLPDNYVLCLIVSLKIIVVNEIPVQLYIYMHGRVKCFRLS